jgi:2-iminobutanoate/2-iminopropanoate deaminase
MFKRIPPKCGDETLSCVVAGDYIFLARHVGGPAGATLDDMVRNQLFLKDTADFDDAHLEPYGYIKDKFPARMTSATNFLDYEISMTGIAYKPQVRETT